MRKPISVCRHYQMIPAKTWTSQGKTDLSPRLSLNFCWYKARTPQKLFRFTYWICNLFIAIAAILCWSVSTLRAAGLTSDSLKVGQIKSSQWLEPPAGSLAFASGRDRAEAFPPYLPAEATSGWNKLRSPWWRMLWKTTQGNWGQDVPVKTHAFPPAPKFTK